MVVAMFGPRAEPVREQKEQEPRTSGNATLIADHTTVRGDIRFSGELFVNGRVEGDVVGEGDRSMLTVNESGTVVGQIEVSSVIINGRVEGDIRSTGKLELAERANLTGNVTYRAIEMRLGAVLEGELIRIEGKGEKAEPDEGSAQAQAEDGAGANRPCAGFPRG